MKRQDWLLALLGMPDRDGGSPERIDKAGLQRALFVLGKNLALADFYQFTPNYLGPCSPEIDVDARRLESQGYVREVQRPGEQHTAYLTTEVGKREAEKVSRSLDEREREEMLSVREWVHGRSLMEALAEIYGTWPDARMNTIASR